MTNEEATALNEQWEREAKAKRKELLEEIVKRAESTNNPYIMHHVKMEPNDKGFYNFYEVHYIKKALIDTQVFLNFYRFHFEQGLLIIEDYRNGNLKAEKRNEENAEQKQSGTGRSD